MRSAGSKKREDEASYEGALGLWARRLAKASIDKGAREGALLLALRTSYVSKSRAIVVHHGELRH